MLYIVYCHKFSKMFDIEIKNISRIVESVLGNPRRDVNLEGWTEYNCPYCSEADGIERDGKYNCCINFREGYFHCWKCSNSGKLSRIIREYGGQQILSEYYNELKSIKNSREYQFAQDNKLVNSELSDSDVALKLPDNFRLISSADSESYMAYKYLKSRGLNYEIINEYGIGYVPWSDNYKMRSRIVIPSYDQYRNLNYYVTRDYTGKQKLKYINPNIDKKKVIFNEGKINWCENIVLCEGIFDSMVIPNSIPLLGKVLNEDFAVYQAIIEKAREKVIIFLDDDALNDAKKIYMFLNTGRLKNKIKIIECPQGYDASLYYQYFGIKGILNLLRSARSLKEYELL